MKLSTLIYQSALKTFNILPFKKGICVVLRSLPFNIDKFYKDYKFKGVFKVKVKDGNDFKMYHHATTIENEIFWKGLDNGWEKISINLWKELSKKSKYILDVGANTGVYSLISKSVNPNSEVYAFEPSQRVFDKLEKNKLINNFDFKTSSIAVSDKNGEAIFYDFDSDHQYSASLNSEMFDETVNKKKVTVKTQTLDSFFEEHNIEGLDLVKIDVEKHEAEVIEGMKNLIEKFKPTMLIEILEDNIGSSIEKAIEGNDYLFFNIDEVNPPKQVDHLKKSSHYNYLLCSPDVAKSLQLL